jgi:hypothetical protein
MCLLFQAMYYVLVVVRVKDKCVVVLLLFLVLRDPFVWTILMTTVTLRKVVKIVLEVANATAVLFNAQHVLHVLNGSDMFQRVNAVLNAEPAVILAPL